MRTACLFATVLVAFGLNAGTASAEPAKCIRELPKQRTEHWSYRYINGQRCWYPDGGRAAAGRGFRIGRSALAQGQAPQSLDSRRDELGPAPVPATRPQAPAATADLQNGMPAGQERAVRTRNGTTAARAQVDPTGNQPKLSPAEGDGASARFAEVWRDRVNAREQVRRVDVAGSDFRLAGSSRAVPPTPGTAHQSDPPAASTASFFGTALWLLIGIGLGMGLTSVATSPALRSRCRHYADQWVTRAQVRHLRADAKPTDTKSAGVNFAGAAIAVADVVRTATQATGRALVDLFWAGAKAYWAVQSRPRSSPIFDGGRDGPRGIAAAARSSGRKLVRLFGWLANAEFRRS